MYLVVCDICSLLLTCQMIFIHSDSLIVVRGGEVKMILEDVHSRDYFGC